MKTMHALGCFVAGMIMMGLINHHRKPTRPTTPTTNMFSMSWSNTCFGHVIVAAKGNCILSNWKGQPIYTNLAETSTSYFSLQPQGSFTINGRKIISIQMEEF